MKAKTEFTRGKIAIITMVYTGAETERYAATIEDQCQWLLDAARERMPDHLAENVVRNALIQYGCDEAIEVLESEDVGDPSQYSLEPEPPVNLPKGRPMNDVTQDTAADAADATATATADAKAPRAGKYDNAVFRLKTNENWRRPNSHGNRTIQALIDAGGEMTGKQLVEAGGRIVDVMWDLKKSPDKIERIE